MDFTIDGTTIAIAVAALLLGLALGWLLFRGAGRRAELEEELADAEGRLAAQQEHNIALERELAANR
ncbi:MAG: hypothetical protein AAGD40_12260, partial [Pseudomonadota bacterium]